MREDGRDPHKGDILEERMGKTYLITSGKGGTGKTMFAVNFGATLAMRGQSVVVLDMDLGLRNLDLYFGLENNVVYDVYDVLTGLCRIKQALIRDKRFDSLYVMAASPVRDDGTLTPLHMKVLCEKLKSAYDYFSWTVVLAPAEDPEIAVVVMLVEGGWSTTAAPVTKDILNAYFGL